MNRDFFDCLKLVVNKLKYRGGALISRSNILFKPTYTDSILKTRRELGRVKFPIDFWNCY